MVKLNRILRSENDNNFNRILEILKLEKHFKNLDSMKKLDKLEMHKYKETIYLVSLLRLNF